MKPEVVEKLTGIISAAVREAIARADFDESTSNHAQEPRLFTALEVADRLRVNTQAVYRLAREGKLPPVRLSARTLRWSERIVSDFVARGGARGVTPPPARGAAEDNSLSRRTPDGTD